MSDGGVVKLPDPDISFDLERLSSKPTYRPTPSPVATTTTTSSTAAATATATATVTTTTTTTTTTATETTATTTAVTAAATTTSTPSTTQRNDNEYYSCPAPPVEIVTSKDDRGNVVSVEIPPPVSTVVVQYDFELQLLQELDSTLNSNSGLNSTLNSTNLNSTLNSEADEEAKQTSHPIEREVNYIDSTILPEIQRRVGRAVASALREHTENGDDDDVCSGYFVEDWRRRRRGQRALQVPARSHSRWRRLRPDDPSSPTRTKIIALSTSPAAPYRTLTTDDALRAPRQCSPPYEGCYVVRGRLDVTYVGYNEAGVASEIVHFLQREMDTANMEEGREGLPDNYFRSGNHTLTSAAQASWPPYRLKFLGPSSSSDDGHVRTANTPSAIVSTLGERISSVLPETDGGISAVGIGIVAVLAATFLVAVYAIFVNDERVHVDEVVDKVKDKSGRVLTKSGKALQSRKRNRKKNKHKSQPLGDVAGDFDSDGEEEQEQEQEQGSPANRHHTSTICHSYDLEQVVDWQSHRGSDGYIPSANNNKRQASHSSSSPTRSKSQVAAAATSIAVSSLSQAESSFLQQQRPQPQRQPSRSIPSSTQQIRPDTPHSETPSYSANSSDAIHGYPSPTMALKAIHAGASVSGGSVRTTRSANEHEKATPVRANKHKRAAVTDTFHRPPPVALVDRTPSVTTSSAGSDTHTSLRQLPQHPHPQQQDPHQRSSPSNAKLNAAAAMIIDLPSPISSSGNSIGSYGSSRLQTVPEANLPPPAHDTPHKSKSLSYPTVSPSVVSLGSSHSAESHRFRKDSPTREIDDDWMFEAIEVSEVVHHQFDGDEEMWEV